MIALFVFNIWLLEDEGARVPEGEGAMRRRRRSDDDVAREMRVIYGLTIVLLFIVMMTSIYGSR
jgi:hypothetical protein